MVGLVLDGADHTETTVESTVVVPLDPSSPGTNIGKVHYPLMVRGLGAEITVQQATSADPVLGLNGRANALGSADPL